MRKPSLFQGIVVAAGLALVAASLVELIPRYSRWTLAAWDAIVAIVALLYILLVLAHARGKTGRFAVGVISTVPLISGVLFGINLPVMLCLAVALIWLSRTLYAHTSLIGAAQDAFLSVVALGWAVGTLSLTRSFVWAVWCFFLVQALFVVIPVKSFSLVKEPVDADAFARAYAAAEGAVRELEVRSPIGR